MITQKRSTRVTPSSTTDEYVYDCSCTAIVTRAEQHFAPTLQQRIEALLHLEKVFGKGVYIHLTPHAQSIVYAELFEHD